LSRQYLLPNSVTLLHAACFAVRTRIRQQIADKRALRTAVEFLTLYV